MFPEIPQVFLQPFPAGDASGAWEILQSIKAAKHQGAVKQSIATGESHRIHGGSTCIKPGSRICRKLETVTPFIAGLAQAGKQITGALSHRIKGDDT